MDKKERTRELMKMSPLQLVRRVLKLEGALRDVEHLTGALLTKMKEEEDAAAGDVEDHQEA